MTTASDLQVVPHQAASLPQLRAAGQGLASSLESVISDNTRRVYGVQWRIFESWCGEVGLRSLPAEPLTVARYLAARAGSGTAVPTLRLAASAIAKAHEWAAHESPCQDRGVRASLKGWGRRLGKPQRQAGALTAQQPRKRGRGIETADQSAERARFDLALVAVLSDGGLRRSEAVALIWGDVARWDDGSGRITVVRSKTDVEAQGAVVAITRAAMKALDAIPYWMDGAADMADTRCTPFETEPDAAPVRLIVRRVKPTPGSQLALFANYSYHGCITDRDGDTLELDTLELEADHRHHAEIENAIRDLKYGVGLNHLPSGRFPANAAWLAVQVIAHNLARWTARIGLGEQILTTKTLRRRFFSLAGRITRRARRLTLHLPQGWPWQNQFMQALARLRALPLPS